MSEKNFHSLLEQYALHRKPDDIIAGGCTVEGDISGEFIPDLTVLFFRFDGIYLACESVGQFSALRLTFRNDIFYNQASDDVKYGFISLTRILETNLDLGDIFIKEIYLFDADEKDGEITCNALMFEMSDGSRLFLDPAFPWGIKAGGRRCYEEWIENRYSRSPGSLGIKIIR